ncbi:MAG: spermidine/putrescine ABC transporter substrate-binding protein [Opitutales bacterium]|nr:spermidine/putrescine ABC transporter substrate-binding protein [Opitutales bacterium]
MKNILTKTLTSIALLLSTLIVGCGPSKPTLNVYTWSDYIDETLVAEFEQKYNCKVIIDTFDSNEFMYSKLKAGATGYDIIIPTSYMAKLMYEQKMIDKLDLAKIPNSKFINKLYLANLAFDSTMLYSIPYMLGYTCIAYNKEKLGKIENSWNVFSRSDLKGRMTLLDDMRETIGAGLFYVGSKINTTDDSALNKAKTQILEWKKNLAKFDNEVYKIGITSGEFLVVQGYSGDLLQAISEAKHLDIMIPREGVSISCDDMVIPSTAPNKELAYKFINFFIEPKNAAKNMEYTCFFAPVDGAKKFAKDIDFDRVFPSILYKTGQLIMDMGDLNKKYQEVWNEVKMDK